MYSAIRHKTDGPLYVYNALLKQDKGFVYTPCIQTQLNNSTPPSFAFIQRLFLFLMITRRIRRCIQTHIRVYVFQFVASCYKCQRKENHVKER